MSVACQHKKVENESEAFWSLLKLSISFNPWLFYNYSWINSELQWHKAENNTRKHFQELTDFPTDAFCHNSNFNLSIFICSYRKQIALRYKNWAFFFFLSNTKFVSIL